MRLRLQKTILEMIALAQPLAATTDRLCREVEAMVPDCVCSIVLVDPDRRLRRLAGPSLPEFFCAAIDGVEIGCAVGSCGTAAFRAEAVTVTDISTDPLWANYKQLALGIGLNACWSSPIFGRDGRVIGCFAFYFRDRRGPSALERGIVDTCVDLCAIAIERHETEAENMRLAYFDALTGLANRAHFDIALDEVEAESPFGLLLIDVDKLKFVNDTLGHAGGDELLREVATRLAAGAPDGRAYRLSGDEFAVIVRSPDPDRDIGVVAETILRSLNVPMICRGQTIHPRVTIGGAVFGLDADTIETLRQNADFALYHAKEQTRGRFVRFSPRLGATMARRLRAIRDVQEAIDEGRVEAYYQPIVRLEDGLIVGVEALCRVWTTEGERMPCDAFTLAMTDVATGANLTERMLTMIATDVRFWLDAGVPFQHVGVNVSTGDFVGGDLEERISAIFERRGVPLRHIILEVTEMVYMGDSDMRVAEAVKALRSRGLLVALDDFGTGYASLTHLLSFPVDVIKIDKSFVSDLTPGAPGAAIVEGLIDIARKLGMRVVAEGVETAAQAKRLQSYGCRLAQGYHFARPADARTVTAMLLSRSQGIANPAIEAPAA